MPFFRKGRLNFSEGKTRKVEQQDRRVLHVTPWPAVSGQSKKKKVFLVDLSDYRDFPTPALMENSSIFQFKIYFPQFKGKEIHKIYLFLENYSRGGAIT